MATVVPVVAGVLRDAQGRYLLAQRPPGRDFAGSWEFPGGKVERGECAQDALRRELHEELGIRLRTAEPLIAVPHADAQRRIVLEALRVTQYDGVPCGREGQALAWVGPQQLALHAMPPADRPIVAALLQPDRYLVTPEPGEEDAAFVASVRHALEHGIRRMQLRASRVDAARYRRLVDTVQALCGAHGAELLLNGGHADAVEVARSRSLPLHLPSRMLGLSLPDVEVRAASCHDVRELDLARARGCAFVVLGAVAPTPTHPHGATLGWDGFAAIRETSDLPIYALGGLSLADLPRARAHGAQGIAAIRALWPAIPHVNPAVG